MRSDLSVLPIRHHISKYLHGGLMAQYDRPSHIWSFTRRIDGTIRPSITPLAVPSISPYNRFFAGVLVIRSHSNSDLNVLPIRHHISKYLHGCQALLSIPLQDPPKMPLADVQFECSLFLAFAFLKYILNFTFSV